MRAIFISYRRDDTEGYAGRLFRDLRERFGKEAVFMDVAGIEPGRDFRRVIEDQVASCGVLLAVIGKAWLTTVDEHGKRRLDDPNDFVRLETASALKRDIPVIPVLVQQTEMVREEQLPEGLKDLAFRNSVELTHARWESDVELLIAALQRYVDPPPARRCRGAAGGNDGAAEEPPSSLGDRTLGDACRRWGRLCRLGSARPRIGRGDRLFGRNSRRGGAGAGASMALASAPAAAPQPVPAAEPLAAPAVAPPPALPASTAVVSLPASAPASAVLHAPARVEAAAAKTAPTSPTSSTASARRADQPVGRQTAGRDTRGATTPPAPVTPKAATTTTEYAGSPLVTGPSASPALAAAKPPEAVVAAVVPAPAPAPEVVPARPGRSLELMGMRGDPSAAVNQTIVITPEMSYVNVTSGDVVRFVVGGKSFIWVFNGTRTSFDLAQVAPDVLSRKVTAYVAHDTGLRRR